MKIHHVGAVCASVMLMGLAIPAQSAVINSYFGMDFVAAGAGVGSVGSGFEGDLESITYIGAGGATFTAAMPAFPADPLGTGFPGSPGLPDATGLKYVPTYTTQYGLPGDGETTRTINATVPINWDTSGAFPEIGITSITVYTPSLSATWTASASPGAPPYIVGLIPAGSNTELHSLLAGPQGDIYAGLSGFGNPIRAFNATSVDNPSLQNLVGSALGTFTFAAAAPVPVPAAAWLFGSGLLGLMGIARRRKASA